MPVPRARLVGRAHELGELKAALDDVRSGASRTVVIAGEAGIGKTRLLDELTAHTDGVTVVAGQCADEGSGPVPYAALAGLLNGIVQAIGPEAAVAAAGPSAGALSAVAPQLVPPASDAGADRLPEVLTDLLAGLAAERPVLVVMEDLHWSDDVTRAVALRLARTAPPNLLLLLTYRSDDVGRAHPLRTVMAELDRARLTTRLDLTRLGETEVRQMAQDLLGGAPGHEDSHEVGHEDVPGGGSDRDTGLDPEALADLADRSGGVPFYVEELVGFLGTDLPGSLRDILLLRYWNLSREAQALCRVVAVAGPRVWYDVLDDVLADPATGSGQRAGAGVGPDPEETAREAVDAQVLVATDVGYAFRHALAQEAVYAELLPGERRRLHAAYARALERALVQRARSVAKLSRIADHWWRAGMLDKALAAAVVGHRAAADEAASSAAVALGERALELWEQVPDAEAVAGLPHHELLRTVAESLRGSTRTGRALAVAHEALAEWPDDDPVGLARMLSDTALIAGHAGSGEGPELIERALALVEPGRDDAVRGQVLLLRARHAMLDGRSREGIETATAAYDAGVAIGSAELMSVALNLRGVSRMQLGDLDGFAEIERGREVAGDAWQGLSRYYINGSDALLTIGDWAGAAKIAQDGVAAARRYGASEGSRIMIEGNIVEARIGQGDWAEAAEWYERTVPLVHDSVYAVYLGERRTWLAMWRGDVEQAQAEARRRAATWERFGRLEAQIRSRVAVTRAELALLRDEPAEALECVSAVISPDDPHIPLYDLPRLAVGAQAIARLRAGGRSVDDAPYRAALARCAHWRTFPVWSAAFEAELGTGPWTTVAELPGPAHLRPYALYREGARLLEAGDRAGARTALGSAVAEAEKLGAGLIVRWAQDLTDRAGLLDRAGSAGRAASAGHAGHAGPADVPPSGSGPDALTAREQQVLALVAEGLTNGQIAERLFISAKTASVHVSAILRKLGVATRTEAALRAVR
ncbi:regulatory LuxR family protein [Promicromonospora sp. AC04]|uniref:helix-turn-helix transcriptional regulator n=1 Tax=Promicromonospora sp. AC04 TaxID=2135723 RepID=UPI000D48971A|nr:AAA family ATPase [Promicromonospora sp. AC04]PUB27167.1 regulatory LuxR family protein [Promicromonospora sp. AC04]